MRELVLIDFSGLFAYPSIQRVIIVGTKTRLILKIIVSIIFVIGLAFCLYVLVTDSIVFNFKNCGRIQDMAFYFIWFAMLASWLLFFILWNIIKSKRVYALLFVPLLGLAASILYIWGADYIHARHALVREAEWHAAQEAERDRVEAERSRIEAQRQAERQARLDRMDAVMYVSLWDGVAVLNEPGGRRIETLPYRAAVKLSRDEAHMVRPRSDWMVFIAHEDIEGWVAYRNLTETIEFESIVGFWEEEGSGDVWRFDSDGGFFVRWGGRGSYELFGDNRIILTFDRPPSGFALLLGNQSPEASAGRRLYMEAEVIFVDKDKRILRFVDRVISIR